MKLVVAIHDVTPAHADAVEHLWDMCRERHVRPALFIVPNWHGEWPIEDFVPFLRWVRARAAGGAEVFLHGERHDEIGSPRALVDEWRAIGRTDREGEFLTLTPDAARARIQRGVRRLRHLGLAPIGFVAPAWLVRRECLGIIGEAGLALSEDVGGIYLHGRGTRLDSPVVRWSARTPLRARMSAAFASFATWQHRRHWLVRLALHPQDLGHSATARSVEWSLDHWVRARIPWPYGAL
jgi:predicted deacetylase